MEMELPAKYRNLAKNPNCGSKTPVNCWHCGRLCSKKANLLAHHNFFSTDSKHVNKNSAYYIKGVTGLFPQANPPVILRLSETILVQQPENIGAQDSQQPVENTGSQDNQEPDENVGAQDGEQQAEIDQPAEPEQPREESSSSRKRTRDLDLFSCWGQIARLESEVKTIIAQVSDPETAEYLKLLKSSLAELQSLENELKHENKRLKNERLKTEDLNNNLGLAMEYIRAKQEEQKKEEVVEHMKIDNQPAVHNHVPAEELAQIDPTLHKVAREVVAENNCIDLEDGHFICNVCFNNWNKTGLMKTRPNCKFVVHRNSKQKIRDHIRKSDDHRECFEAKTIFAKQDKVLRKLMESESTKVYTATCNVIRCVYFILRYNISANMYENLVNLLDVLNAIIGNQLHSRKTAATIALAIDEVYARMLVNYIVSDECKYFSTEFDELTDKGLLKTLLSKIRLNENKHLQSFVFNIFESSGTSEMTFESFKADFFKNFELAGLSEEETMKILNAKWIAGTSDRASKMNLLGKFFFDALEKYVHIPCDNHEKETARNNTTEGLEHLQSSKETINDSYALQSRSSKRTKRLQELAEKHETKHRKMKRVYDVRFLTHLEEAMDAELQDHEQLLEITKDLSKERQTREKGGIQKSSSTSQEFRKLLRASSPEERS